MTQERRAVIAELAKLVESNQIDLAEEVIEAKEGEASDINNAGVEEQLSYLLGVHGLDYLRDLVTQ